MRSIGQLSGDLEDRSEIVIERVVDLEYFGFYVGIGEYIPSTAPEIRVGGKYISSAVAAAV
jgi:hypothetical protein